jgi:hypothetical protein
MKAEQLQLALRPRPAYEAVDLGVRMTQRGAGSLCQAYLPFALLLAVACGATIELAAWLPSLLLWWLKPWLDRILLNVYARQAFGESTRFADAWEARRRAPWAPLIHLLTLGRLSPWRSYAMPVTQLEGQAGAARRERLQAILRTQRSAATMTQQAFAGCELVLIMALLSLGPWMTPGLRNLDALQFLLGDNLSGTLLIYAAQVVAMTFLEPFYVASGFAMYLNRRVELEAWDVEQELRDAFDVR